MSKETMIRVINQLRSEGTAFVVVTHSDAFCEALHATKTIDLE
jgi:Fe-S cluster assembly ATPase SufC